MNNPLVGIIMGSQSDWPDTMKFAADTLQQLGVPFESKIVSAHRTPERLFEYSKSAKSRGLKVIIAGAGGAAHLPGMVASLTTLPVLGVPVQSKALSGMDSLLSIVQMPGGIPVGTLAIGRAGAINAAILATSILASSGNYPDIEQKLDAFRAKQTENVAEFPVDESSSSSSTSHNAVSHSTTSAPVVPVPNPVTKQVIQHVSQLPLDPSQERLNKTFIPTGSTIGIIGGGQLAKMTSIAAANLGYKVIIFAPEDDAPAYHASYSYMKADYLDKDALTRFANAVDVITYEFENIPAETLEHLAKYVPVRPKPFVNRTAQDRFAEKSFVRSLGVETAPFEKIENINQLHEALGRIGYPAVLKSNNFGYDGKGQYTIRSASDIEEAWKKMESVHSKSAILEGFVDFEKEVSVIVARGVDGTVQLFPLVENAHEHHILKVTTAPAQVPENVHQQAAAIAHKIADGFGDSLVGIVAVEMFVTRQQPQRVLVNELAPRPHNSGHWSIEGCSTSQFEQLVRCVCGLPLGQTIMTAPKVTMTNLLGEEVNQWLSWLQQPNVHLHLYGKPEIRAGRKLGHVTQLFF